MRGEKLKQRKGALMSGWDDLAGELELWRAAGRTATFWWRDDDARTATPALARLLALRSALGCPLALAVIPAGADETLIAAISAENDIAVLQHGYAHVTHAPPGEDKIELGARTPSEIGAELARGREMLATLTGTPPDLLVPPWNRIDPSLPRTLPALGFRGLSGFKARPSRTEGGLAVVNAHIDIVDWPTTRAFCGDEAALGHARDHLAARRTGAADDAEPTGLLTHHLAHDPGCWRFIERFVATTSSHPAGVWLSAAQAFEAAR
jgi:peptidoglycan/xylan/chitin deacetylase (PgdA/CDA1 family)